MKFIISVMEMIKKKKWNPKQKIILLTIKELF